MFIAFKHFRPRKERTETAVAAVSVPTGKDVITLLNKAKSCWLMNTVVHSLLFEK